MDTLIDMEAFSESPRDVKLISRTAKLLQRSRNCFRLINAYIDLKLICKISGG